MKAKLILIGVVLAAVAGLAFLSMNGNLSPDPENEPTSTPEPNITVESPLPNAQVGNPIVVTGQARVFENTFAYVLRDREGNKLYENFAMTDAPDSGIFGNYNIKIPVPFRSPTTLVVEVFEYSAKDGSVVNLVSVPVEIASRTTTAYKMNFLNNELDPSVSCEKTFPVEREVYLTQEPGFVSLSELLMGPTEGEEAKGYFTSINPGVRINSARIQNGVFYVDFNEALEMGVAGSCTVLAIRAQITDTLKQFPSVQEVVISVNGRTDDILQP